MMRPHAIRGQRAIDYYLALAREVGDTGQWAQKREDGEGHVEDYYLSSPDEAPGTWWGDGAKTLGLDGEGNRAQMAALLQGRHPVTGDRLGRPPRADGVRAYDLTFSAPKTVSVLAAFLGGRSEQVLLEAHDNAVKAALAMLEERATTRAGTNGVIRLETGGLTVLLVRHRTSRALDPQLHTHALVFAKVEGSDGRWRALDASIVFRAQRTFGAVYQAALRSELTRAGGVRWGPVVKGQAEIEGMQELVDAFSRRHRAVMRLAERKLAAWGERHPGREPTERERSVMIQQAARESRPAKQRAYDAEQLREAWLRIANQRDFDLDHIRTRVLHRVEISQGGAPSEDTDSHLVAQEALASLSEQKSVWSIEDLEREVAFNISSYAGRSAFAQRRSIEALAHKTATRLCVDLLAEIEAPATSLALDPCLERYTTTELIEQEQRIVCWLDQAAAGPGQSARDRELAHALARIARRDGQAQALDPCQAQAAALAAGTHRACVIEGPAGAGKTATLRVAVDALEAKRANVIGLAPTAVAAERLERSTGIACQNVAEFLTEQTRVEPLRPDVPGRGETLIVDEAGMVNTPDFEALLRVANKRKARVVLVGDRRQLGPVGRGGMFEHARELLPAVELTQVHRFRQPWEAEVSLQLRAGDAGALDHYIERGRVIAGPAEAVYERMIADWARAHEAGLRHAFNVPTNEQARYLNARAQQRLIEAGEVSSIRWSETARGEHLHVGDLVATRLNARGPAVTGGERVRNRETWLVKEVAPDGSLTLQKPDRRREVTLHPDYARERVELAYFRTTHGVQGVTAEVGGTLVDERSGFRSLYTGMTRGREENIAYVVCDDPEQTRDVMERALERDRADLGVLAYAHVLERDAERAARERGLRKERASKREIEPPGIGIEIGP
jgi:conjugative relaxase-like TrwC/TraI family protein